MAGSNKEDYHYPHVMRSDYKKKLDKAIELVKDGLPAHAAVVKAYGVHESRWKVWVKDAIEDIEKGYEKTPLINAVIKISQADVDAHHRLMGKANEIAIDDGNVDMIKFLLERRFGYKKKSQKEVEVATPEDFSFNINITEAKDD